MEFVIINKFQKTRSDYFTAIDFDEGFGISLKSMKEKYGTWNNQNDSWEYENRI